MLPNIESGKTHQVDHLKSAPRFFSRLAIMLVFSLGMAGLVLETGSSAGEHQQPEPQPAPDRLEIPILPENPTELDIGRSVYYYNCMPCHGDRGQGLTDEWRQVWVEDHQNCWDRGCHAGRVEDEGFPIPKFVPAVSKIPGSLAQFTNHEELFAYLQVTHPPQQPGILSEDEYRAVTSFLLFENGRLPLQGENHSTGQIVLRLNLPAVAAVLILILILALLLVLQTKISRSE